MLSHLLPAPCHLTLLPALYSLTHPLYSLNHTHTHSPPPPSPRQVKCEERMGWVTYDQETTRFKMYVERDGMLQDTTPQQFELDAGNHSRKWKSSFRLLGGCTAGGA